MKKIAIINQRYGLEVNGGSELYSRQIAERLAAKYEVEVLTSCAIEYVNWANHYKEGVETINGVTVRDLRHTMRECKEYSQALVLESIRNPEADKELSDEWMNRWDPYCPGSC